MNPSPELNTTLIHNFGASFTSLMNYINDGYVIDELAQIHGQIDLEIDWTGPSGRRQWQPSESKRLSSAGVPASRGTLYRKTSISMQSPCLSSAGPQAVASSWSPWMIAGRTPKSTSTNQSNAVSTRGPKLSRRCCGDAYDLLTTAGVAR